ncbi:hypothetical protein Sjap_023273 [Stephania japonica]|uniref:PH domain-containing protein n=1 Tax=Stephania japonica TaxID=461633 RepID=A0AAP0EBA6_9MAGN
MKIIPGTVYFRKRLQPEKESQSFSITYANGERSLDLMCKDKEQAEIWMVGLRALVFRSRNQRPSAHLRSHNGAQICDNSPVGYTRRKHNLDELPVVTTKYSLAYIQSSLIIYICDNFLPSALEDEIYRMVVGDYALKIYKLGGFKFVMLKF